MTRLLFTLGILCAGICVSGFLHVGLDTNLNSAGHNRIHNVLEYITTYSDSVMYAVHVLEGECEILRHAVIQDQLRLDDVHVAYERLKAYYKRIEPFVEYIEPEYTAQHVNGAPLPRLDKKSQFVDVLEPQGLQIVDELLHADTSEVFASRDRIYQLVSTLGTALHDVLTSARRAPWTDRMLIECSRTEVLRITALGITGFDRPASEPQVHDDVTALSTVVFIVKTFNDDTEASRKSVRDALKYARMAQTLLRQAVSFDNVDRAKLIRNCLDPLYGALLDIQQSRDIEFAHEVSSAELAVNASARSMFSTHTLNSYRNTSVVPRYRTPRMIELGRTLFFDPVLSVSNDRSCASCHQPERAFTDGLAKGRALGKNGSIGRNTPTLINAALSSRFFMDLRAAKLDDVIEHVVSHKDEFGSSTIDVVGKVQASDEYRRLFEDAFAYSQFPGNQVNTNYGASSRSQVTLSNIGIAISSYIASLTTLNSPIDRYLRGERQQLSKAALRGFNLFMGRAACGTCHFAPSFSGLVPPTYTETESEVLGVAIEPDTSGATLDPDIGRQGGILRENTEIYRNSFKTPTLRNIALTAPYMHNGAYKTLTDVMKFYELGGGNGIGIDHPHQTLAPDRVELTRKDHADLLAFLNTLTDTSNTMRKPSRLPMMNNPVLQSRSIGGEY